MSKVIIITGSSQGLGREIANQLLKANHKVFLVARSEAKLRELKAAHAGVEFLSADLGDLEVAPKIISAALKAFGRIDGVVINHGTLSPITRICDSDVDAWRRAYDVNFFGTLALVKESIPELRKSNGRVIFVSSGASTSPYISWGAYGTSKAAMNHLCAHLAAEEPSITAVAISPGKVDTAMQKLIRDEGHVAMPPELHAAFVADHDNGRLLNPNQPGTVIAKLAVGAPSALTGKHYRWNAAELADFQP